MPLTPPAGSDVGPDLHAGAVPGLDSAAPAPGHAPSGAAPRRAAIDLNRADARELDGLPGIGPVIARRIVLQRRRFGPFQGVDELLAVRGVGPRLLERIRPWATVGPSPDGAPPPSATREDSTSKTLR
jgi:competence protein ComEA